MYAIENQISGVVYKYVGSLEEAQNFINQQGEVADLLNLAARKVDEKL